MYPNLERELQRKKVSAKLLAAMLGISDKTLYNKMHGGTDFTLPEALVISRDILPEFQLAYLFEKDGEAA